MYEISPYATFSMSGGAEVAGGAGGEAGAGAGGAVGGVHLRTFGHGDEPVLSAPARPTLHSHKHRSFNKPGTTIHHLRYAVQKK